MDHELDRTSAETDAVETLGATLDETAETVTAQLGDLHAGLSGAGAHVADTTAAEAAQAGGQETLSAVDDVAEASGDAPVGGVLPPLGASWVEETAVETARESSDDRLLAGLTWLSLVVFSLPIMSIILLLSESNSRRAFQKHHAVSSLLFFGAAIAFEVVAGIIYTILGLVTLGLGFACLWPIFLLPHAIGLYFAFKAYNGKLLDLPVLTSFGRGQGWL